MFFLILVDVDEADCITTCCGGTIVVVLAGDEASIFFLVAFALADVDVVAESSDEAPSSSTAPSAKEQQHLQQS